MRKEKQARRNRKIGMMPFILFTIIIIIALAVFIPFFGRDVSAEESKGTRCYTNYVVKYGDTLWGIAQSHISRHNYEGACKAYVRDIMDTNQKHTSDIYDGEILIIPYYIYAEENNPAQAETFVQAEVIQGKGLLSSTAPEAEDTTSEDYER